MDEGSGYNGSRESGSGYVSGDYGSGDEGSGSGIDEMEIFKIDKIFSILFGFQASLSTILNASVIITYILMQELRKKIPNFLFFCTSLVDMFNSALFWFHFVYTAQLIKDPSDIHYYVDYMVLEYSFWISLLTLLLSAVDRCISVTKPFLHMSKVTLGRVKCVYAAIWVVSTIPMLVRMGLTRFRERNMYEDADTTYLYTGNALLLALIITVFAILIKTYRTCRSAIKNRGTVKGSETTVAPPQNDKQIRLIKIFLIMSVSYTLSYLPITIYKTLQYMNALEDIDDTSEANIISHVFDNLYFASAITNPIITLSMQKDYRHAFLKCFRRQRGRLASISFISNNSITHITSV